MTVTKKLFRSIRNITLNELKVSVGYALVKAAMTETSHRHGQAGGFQNRKI
jgi:hypothetical protein